MLEINNALRSFWQRFNLPVFFQNLAAGPFPYITFEYSLADFALEYGITGRLWVRDASHPQVSTGFPQNYWDTLSLIEQEIPTNSGILLPLENEKGTIFLTRGTPFILHNAPTEQATVKSALINLNVKYYTN